MPVVAANQSKLVLVTGANGYIALWIVKNLLEQGYKVRGTVRSEAKGQQLVETFKDYPGKVEFAIVEDITKDGAFDAAVVSVDAVLHTASPVTAASEDVDQIVKPAVEGTVSVLKSALSHGSNIKRIIITSSCASLHRNVTEPVTFDESDWAEQFIQYVKAVGSQAPFIVKYLVSKALAEKAAWEFYEQHKSEVQWDLTTLLPPNVMGAPLQVFKSPKELPLSLGLFYKSVAMEQPREAIEAERSFGYVHVKDVAHAHVKTLGADGVAGQRIIIASGSTTWKAVRDNLRAKEPELYTSGRLFPGYADINAFVIFNYKADRSKALLGMTYRTIDEIVSETVEYMKPKGWFPEGRFTSA